MTLPSLHISVAINCPPSQVYDFASNPNNLPKWASGLSGSIKNVNGDWIAESQMGPVKIRFSDRNDFGVLDHDVTLLSGGVFYNPMRVFPNADGCEVVFTLYRQPSASDAAFSSDAKLIENDLKALKAILEKR